MAEPQRIGQQLGNYRLKRLLGTGGFAEVYLGEHVHLRTEAAIKVLHTRVEQEDAAAFGDEARTIARLKHPHIVRVLDFGIDGTVPYLVMDYAPQGSLRSRHSRGVQLPLPVALSYVRQLGEALQFAHDQKLIHRDLKPENILVDERGNLVLSDFGIATMAQSSRSQNTQDIVGTAAYMAPEQLQGKPRPASDQYSFGIMVYEWLTGTRPFLGTFTEIASQHLLTPPPPLREKRPDLPLAVEQVLMTALAKDSHQRFGSIQAFVTAFAQACEQGQAGAHEHNIKTQISPTFPAGNPGLYPAYGIAPPPPVYGTTSPPPVSYVSGQMITPPVVGSDRLQQRSPRSYAPISTPQPLAIARQEVSQGTKRKSARTKGIYTILAILALIVVVVVVIPIIGASNTTTTTAGSNFRQISTTSTDVISIAVGTGYTSGSSPDGTSTTFQPGDTVYLVCYLVHVGAAITDTLKVGSTTVSTAGGLTDHTDSVFYDYATVQSLGVYTWVVNYTAPDGTQEQASITFQVYVDHSS